MARRILDPDAQHNPAPALVEERVDDLLHGAEIDIAAADDEDGPGARLDVHLPVQQGGDSDGPRALDYQA